MPPDSNSQPNARSSPNSIVNCSKKIETVFFLKHAIRISLGWRKDSPMKLADNAGFNEKITSVNCLTKSGYLPCGDISSLINQVFIICEKSHFLIETLFEGFVLLVKQRM